MGPQDYKFSEWFNRTSKTEALFVPPSCCRLRNDDPRNPDVVNENVCQINAINFLFDNSPINKTQLKTRVTRRVLASDCRYPLCLCGETATQICSTFT